MPIIPAGYAQLNNVLGLTGDTEEMICTMGIRFDDPAPANMQAVVNTLYLAFAGAFDDVVATVYTFKRTDMYVGAVGGSLVFSSTSASVSGNLASGPVPQNCAYLLKKTTATAGRTGRGRMFLPGVPESYVDAVGALTSSAITEVNTACTNYVNAIQATDGVAAASLLHALVGDLPDDVTAMVCDSRIATQRRRLR